ncbi:hypothetical protein CEQ30_28345 [Nocardia brasiliensis]|nr:hypothetical protein CEQ30_28345 [Nocardia brasiliensis]
MISSQDKVRPSARPMVATCSIRVIADGPDSSYFAPRWSSVDSARIATAAISASCSSVIDAAP